MVESGGVEPFRERRNIATHLLEPTFLCSLFADNAGELLHRDWRGGGWTFRQEDEATLRGLAVLAEG